MRTTFAITQIIYKYSTGIRTIIMYLSLSLNYNNCDQWTERAEISLAIPALTSMSHTQLPFPSPYLTPLQDPVSQ
jgi:hypothetical protein